MRQYQSSPFSAIPLKTKVSLCLGAVLVLGLLFFFAFAFFIITIASGLVLFIINLFQRPRKNLGSSPNGQPRPYRRPPSRDNDDVIDI